MASKMLLIITYSSMVFWLILSVTCKHINSHICDVYNKHHNIIHLAVFNMFCLTVTRHSSNLRQRLFRLSEPSPQRRLSSLSIRSCTGQNKTWMNKSFISLFSSPLKVLPTHLHPLLSLVKPHEHVDDVKARCGLVLLVNPPEKCTESLEREVEQQNVPHKTQNTKTTSKPSLSLLGWIHESDKSR